jgi:two-component system LytT family response regulator
MINCIAIDDEPLALQQIEIYITKTPYLNLLGLFESGFEAIEFLGANSVDLMFVDIQMPNLNGMDLVKSLQPCPEIIFTTAFSEYAVDGFKVEALDYILKPLDYATFLKAANKAKRHFERLKMIGDRIDKDENCLFLKSEYKVVRIDIDKIIYIEGEGGYLRFHLENSKSIMSLLAMKKMEEKLAPIHFMRVHRSYLVNLKKISTIERGQIVFGKVRITVSDQYKEKFQTYLDEHFLG